ncbi:hypothetical protein Aduo_004062 [Ancylostoma duodenale]
MYSRLVLRVHIPVVAARSVTSPRSGYAVRFGATEPLSSPLFNVCKYKLDEDRADNPMTNQHVTAAKDGSTLAASQKGWERDLVELW